MVRVVSQSMSSSKVYISRVFHKTCKQLISIKRRFGRCVKQQMLFPSVSLLSSVSVRSGVPWQDMPSAWTRKIRRDSSRLWLWIELLLCFCPFYWKYPHFQVPTSLTCWRKGSIIKKSLSCCVVVVVVVGVAGALSRAFSCCFALLFFYFARFYCILLFRAIFLKWFRSNKVSFRRMFINRPLSLQHVSRILLQ